MTAHHPITEARIPTSAGALFVTQRGAGRPVLLWPSIFTDHHIYDTLTTMMTGCRFILIDGPGHGRSGPPPSSGLTMEACGEAMLEIMDALDLPRATLGGTSWGGIAAAHAALAASGRVDALALLNTPFYLGARAPSLATRLIAVGAHRAPGAALFRKGVARSFFSDPALPGARAYHARFHAMLAGAEGAALGAAVRAVTLASSPLAPRLSEIACPTLVLAGREDEMYPIAQQEAAAAQIPQGQFEAVHGKHISAVDAPGPVAAALTRFLAEHPAAQRLSSEDRMPKYSLKR